MKVKSWILLFVLALGATCLIIRQVRIGKVDKILELRDAACNKSAVFAHYGQCDSAKKYGDIAVKYHDSSKVLFNN